MFKNIAYTGMTMGFAFILSMISTVMLGNIMTPDEFGDFALLKNFILIGATFSILGIDQSIIRSSINGNSIVTYRVVVLVTTILGALFSFIMAIFFSLSIINGIFLWGIIVGASQLLYLASIYRLNRQFIFAQMLQSSWKIILFIVIMVASFINISITISRLYYYLFLVLIATLAIHFIFKNKILCNNNMIEDNLDNYSIIKEGILLWMINISGLLFAGMDRFIIPSISDKGILGAYYALSFIYLTGFTMIGSAVGYVIFPYLSQNRLVVWKKLMIYTSSLLIVVLVVLRLWGNLISHYAFNGKYDFVTIDYNTIPLLIMGILQCLNTIIHFYIYARASRTVLKKYIIFLLAYCFLYYLSFSLFEVFIIYSLSNIILHILILWLIKVVISLIVSFRIISNNINLKTI